MNKKPKVNPYLLFMQEMRQSRPGWANKGNHELQVLCDPLWRALAREEKDIYKMMKKDLKMADRMKLIEERKAEEAKMKPREEKDKYKMMKKDLKMADRMKLIEERKAE